MLSRFLIKLHRRLARQWLGVRRKFWIRKVQLQAFLEGGTLEMQNAPIMDCPLRCDGRGKVQLGLDVKLGYRKAPRYGSGEILLQARKKDAVIQIGSRTATSNNVSIVANHSVTIGEDCLIGEMVSIFDSDFHEIDPAARHHTIGVVQAVSIGKNVWLGSRVIVMKGVNIGNNSVIASGAVVTKSIPENVIAGGIPAKVIRTL